MKKRGRPAKAVEKKLDDKQDVVVEIKEPVNQPRPDKENRTNRPRRSAVGGAGSGGRLEVMGKDTSKYNYFIVTDEGSKIEEFKSYGYEIDQNNGIKFSSNNEISSGSNHSVVVDRRTGAKGILMRQLKEYHEEDRIARGKAIDKTEESMFRELKEADGRYGDVEKTNSLAKKTDD